MDDLSFRKAVLADPMSKDPSLLKAADQDPSKRAFWNEVRSLENELKQAAQLPVPDNLADRLILAQSLDDSKLPKRSKAPWYISIAASVALVSFISFNTLNLSNDKLVYDVLEHMSHAEYEVAMSKNLTEESIKAKLANFNGVLTSEIGKIVSANFCYLDEIRSLHVILESESGLVSMFVVPDPENNEISDSFSDDRYSGRSFVMNTANIIIVGDNQSIVNTFINKAKNSLRFSA